MQLAGYENAADFLAEVRVFTGERLQKEAAKIDRAGAISNDLMKAMAQRRFFVLDRLRESDPPLAAAERLSLVMKLIEEIARVSAAAAKLVLDHNVGQVSLLETHGSESLRARHLPRIQKGESHVSFLLTEPASGSKLGKVHCTATKGKNGFRLNGSKDWVSGAQERDLYLVVARAADVKESFGLFFIDRSDRRVKKHSIRISGKKEPLGLRGIGEYRVDFQDTFVPEEWALIPPRPTGISEIMRGYNLKRCGQAAIAIGVSHAATACAYAYARKRNPGVHGGLAFQDAAFEFAEMHCRCRAAEQVTEWALREIAAGDESGVPSSIAKLFATETAVDVTNRAVQLCGANATTDVLPLERFLRDARMLTIIGGTSEIQKRTIARRLRSLLGNQRNT